MKKMRKCMQGYKLALKLLLLYNLDLFNRRDKHLIKAYPDIPTRWKDRVEMTAGLAGIHNTKPGVLYIVGSENRIYKASFESITGVKFGDIADHQRLFDAQAADLGGFSIFASEKEGKMVRSTKSTSMKRLVAGLFNTVSIDQTGTPSWNDPISEITGPDRVIVTLSRNPWQGTDHVVRTGTKVHVFQFNDFRNPKMITNIPPCPQTEGLELIFPDTKPSQHAQLPTFPVAFAKCGITISPINPSNPNLPKWELLTLHASHDNTL